MSVEETVARLLSLTSTAVQERSPSILSNEAVPEVAVALQRHGADPVLQHMLGLWRHREELGALDRDGLLLLLHNSTKHVSKKDAMRIIAPYVPDMIEEVKVRYPKTRLFIRLARWLAPKEIPFEGKEQWSKAVERVQRSLEISGLKAISIARSCRVWDSLDVPTAAMVNRSASAAGGGSGSGGGPMRPASFSFASTTSATNTCSFVSSSPPPTIPSEGEQRWISHLASLRTQMPIVTFLSDSRATTDGLMRFLLHPYLGRNPATSASSSSATAMRNQGTTSDSRDPTTTMKGFFDSAARALTSSQTAVEVASAAEVVASEVRPHLSAAAQSLAHTLSDVIEPTSLERRGVRGEETVASTTSVVRDRAISTVAHFDQILREWDHGGRDTNNSSSGGSDSNVNSRLSSGRCAPPADQFRVFLYSDTPCEWSMDALLASQPFAALAPFVNVNNPRTVLKGVGVPHPLLRSMVLIAAPHTQDATKRATGLFLDLLYAVLALSDRAYLLCADSGPSSGCISHELHAVLTRPMMAHHILTERFQFLWCLDVDGLRPAAHGQHSEENSLPFPTLTQLQSLGRFSYQLRGMMHLDQQPYFRLLCLDLPQLGADILGGDGLHFLHHLTEELPLLFLDQRVEEAIHLHRELLIQLVTLQEVYHNVDSYLSRSHASSSTSAATLRLVRELTHDPNLLSVAVKTAGTRLCDLPSVKFIVDNWDSCFSWLVGDGGKNGVVPASGKRSQLKRSGLLADVEWLKGQLGPTIPSSSIRPPSVSNTSEKEEKKRKKQSQKDKAKDGTLDGGLSTLLGTLTACEDPMVRRLTQTVQDIAQLAGHSLQDACPPESPCGDRPEDPSLSFEQTNARDAKSSNSNNSSHLLSTKRGHRRVNSATPMSPQQPFVGQVIPPQLYELQAEEQFERAAMMHEEDARFDAIAGRHSSTVDNFDVVLIAVDGGEKEKAEGNQLHHPSVTSFSEPGVRGDGGTDTNASSGVATELQSAATNSTHRFPSNVSRQTHRRTLTL